MKAAKKPAVFPGPARTTVSSIAAKDFISVLDLTHTELVHVLDLAAEV
jgi:hypothetical protein